MFMIIIDNKNLNIWYLNINNHHRHWHKYIYFLVDKKYYETKIQILKRTHGQIINTQEFLLKENDGYGKYKWGKDHEYEGE